MTLKLTTMNKSYGFAYYADGKWLGWYGGTFGTVSKTPKLYNDLDRVRPVLEKNLAHKLTKIKESTFEEARQTVKGLAALSLAYYDGEELLRGKEVELRAVECPHYDGPNPDFDRQKWEDDYRNGRTAEKPNNWVYADYAKVTEWAAQEPQEFVATLKPAFQTQSN